MLARIVLPSEIPDYFEITGAEQTSNEAYIYIGEYLSNTPV